MKTTLKNATGYEVEFEMNDVTFLMQNGAEIELEEIPEPRDIICYNGGNCIVYISDLYNGEREIYIDNLNE
jgi:hypothetical protein